MSAAAERAYEFIRAGILNGDFPAGGRLLEIEVAARAGVSRTPVREAIRRLDAEGLIAMRPRLGAVVRSWSLEEVEDIFSLRAVLEARAVERAASRIAAHDLHTARELAETMADLAEQRRPQSRERIGDLNARFHRLLIEASGSQRLQSMMAQVMDLPLSLRTINRYDEEALVRSTRHHLEIVAALKARDPAWAASVMRSHVLAAWRAIALDAGAREGRGAGEAQPGEIR